MTTEAVVASRFDMGTTNERWAAWVAKGKQHDRAARKRAIAVACAVAVGLALWMTSVLLF